MNGRYALLHDVLIALLVSVVWEFAHASLYGAYWGGSVTSGLVLSIALGKTVILIIIALISGTLKVNAKWCHVGAGATLALMVALNVELYALAAHWWIYASTMPTLPFLGVGISPLLQLPVTVVVMWRLRVGA